MARWAHGLSIRYVTIRAANGDFGRVAIHHRPRRVDRRVLAVVAAAGFAAEGLLLVRVSAGGVPEAGGVSNLRLRATPKNYALTYALDCP